MKSLYSILITVFMMIFNLSGFSQQKSSTYNIQGKPSTAKKIFINGLSYPDYESEYLQNHPGATTIRVSPADSIKLVHKTSSIKIQDIGTIYYYYSNGVYISFQDAVALVKRENKDVQDLSKEYVEGGGRIIKGFDRYHDSLKMIALFSEVIQDTSSIVILGNTVWINNQGSNTVVYDVLFETNNSFIRVCRPIRVNSNQSAPFILPDHTGGMIIHVFWQPVNNVGNVSKELDTRNRIYHFTKDV